MRHARRERSKPEGEGKTHRGRTEEMRRQGCRGGRRTWKERWSEEGGI